ncbi:MAG: AsmA family protein [Bacteroides sp.]|nr:AsmA family protein [Bacteroides sp.]MCM1085821.1 AsmA family protein [Bacteroides sp.]
MKKTKKPLPRWRKALRITWISLLSLVTLITLVLAIAINFIFTPAKVTPLVEKIANEQLNAEVHIGSVELTFFSSYPRVELEVNDGLLVSKALKDSCFDKTDTLISFARCRVNVNIGAYLNKKRLAVRELLIDSANVYVFRSKDGTANYDLVAPSSDTVQAEDTASEAPVKGIGIKSLHLRHANICFDDRANDIYARIENADLKAKLRLGKHKSSVKLAFENDNILFWQNNQLLVNKVSLGIKTGISINSDSCVYHLQGAKIKLNDIGFGAKGDFMYDTLTREVSMDLGFGMRTPSLKDVLGMIPESVVKKTDFDAEGKVEMGCRLRGVYGNGKMPEATLKLKVTNGSAHYAGMPYGIDTLTAHFDAFVDLGKKKASYADLKIFRLKAMDVDVFASCRVDNLLTDPKATLTTTTDLDMNTLKKIIPFQKGVDMGGKVNIDLKGNVRLADVKQKNYAKMVFNGHIDMDGVFFNDTNENFYANTDASLKFKGDRYLGASLTINRIHWKGPRIKAYMDTLRVRAATVPPKDTATTHIIRIGADIKVKKMYAKLFDTILLYNVRTEAKASVKPLPENPRTAFVNFDFETDTLVARSGAAKARLRKASVHLDLTRFRDTLWRPKASVDMRRAVFVLPEFGSPIRFNRLKGSLDGDNIHLNRATVRIGNSHLSLKGDVERLWRFYKGRDKLVADLTIRSKMLDCNQLLNALATPVDSSYDIENVSAEEEAREDAMDDVENIESYDSLQSMPLFLVPDNVDLKLALNARRIVYDRMVFDSILGDVEVRNRALNLKKLDMKALGADMKLTMVYATPTPDKADAGCDLHIKDIYIEQLVKSVPALDSALPMLRSFEGKVDLETTVSTQIDTGMNIILPSLTGAVRLHGENLVLMDGETFAEISKMLMFKNKEKNLIDSISAVITLQDGEVTVYPFIVEIDRYKVGVGGRQDLDMNFNYHISVLKSPVPFKLGINIKGTPDKMKFGIGKALYKNSFTPAEIRKVDSARLNLGQQIVNQFEGWMNRERRVIRRVDFPTVPVAAEGDTIAASDTASGM